MPKTEGEKGVISKFNTETHSCKAGPTKSSHMESCQLRNLPDQNTENLENQ